MDMNKLILPRSALLPKTSHGEIDRLFDGLLDCQPYVIRVASGVSALQAPTATTKAL